MSAGIIPTLIWLPVRKKLLQKTALNAFPWARKIYMASNILDTIFNGFTIDLKVHLASTSYIRDTKLS